MKICVLGTGYVGLVSGVSLAAKGHNVVCVDVRPDIVASLNRAQPHIHEAGLPELLGKVIAERRFVATLSLEEGLTGAEAVLIAVGTPSLDGRIDLQYVRRAAEQIGTWLKTAGTPLSVLVKSTVVPGTTDTVVRAILEETSGKKVGEFGLGMNPEFLREGNAVEDFMNPDRIVFGCEDEISQAVLEKLYASWHCDKITVNTRTAEMIKYANNCLLATQISAVNELANLCFEMGDIDVQEVMQGVHLDRRWSPVTEGGRVRPDILSYLIPGCGFGGSCFPKDVQALRTLGRDYGLPMPVLQSVLDINELQPLQVVRLLKSCMDSLDGRKILVLGLAFKPDTDDVRESASLRIIRSLVQEGSEVMAHDPAAILNAKKELGECPVQFVNDWKPVLNGADAVVIATRWNDYGALARPEIAARLDDKPVVDARRMFRPEDFSNAIYLTIGRRPLKD